jgi:predicted aldo/keto reductase-like oxidoreductase
MVGVQQVETAIRYALGIPGVATVNLGVHTVEQLRQNVEYVKQYRPLTVEEHEQLRQQGQKLAAQWGPHFGPAKENS